MRRIRSRRERLKSLTPFNEVPDGELIEAFKTGADKEAFETLILRHRPSLRRFLVLHLGGSEDLDEVEQETLVRVFGSLGGFAGRSSFTTWLFTVSRRAAADHARRRKRDRNGTARLVLFRPDSDPRERDEPHRQFLDAEMKSEILAALDLLGEPDRSLLYLRDAEGEPLEALAKAFGLPEGTVKSRLSRARQKMRPVLRARLGEAE